MMNDRSDKIIKDRVGSLESIPCVSFNKEAAWDKLEYTLDRKPKKIYLYRWVSVAASLLLLFSLVILNKDTSQLSAKKTDHNKDTFSGKPVMVMHETVIPYHGPEPAIKQSENATHHASGPAMAQIKPKAKKDNTIIKYPSAIYTFQAVKLVITGIKQPDSTVPKLLSQPLAVKQKVKVIHINDLIEEENDIEIIRGDNRMASEGFHFFRQQQNTETPANTNSDEYPLRNPFKIRSN